MNFKELKNEETGVVVFQCQTCNAYVESVDGHRCENKEQRQNEERLRLASTNPLQWYDLELKLWKYQQLPRILSKFGKYYQNEVYNGLKMRLNALQRMKDSIFAHNDVLRSNGVPWSIRAQVFHSDKYNWLCEKELELQKTLKNLKVVPLESWLDWGDYEAMKRMGFRNFINLYLDLCVYKNYM